MTADNWLKAQGHDLDAGQCRHLLMNHVVGRIVFDDDRGPNALPVNYVMDGDDVVFATSPYGEIARHATNHRVAFEVDELQPADQTGWSVVVRGVAEETGYFDLPLEHVGQPYAWAAGSRHFLLRIRPLSVSGRRLDRA